MGDAPLKVTVQHVMWSASIELLLITISLHYLCSG